MRVLAGVVPASAGTVVVDGVDVTADPLGAKHRTGYCPDVGGLLPRATPWEHLQLSASLRRPHGLAGAGRAPAQALRAGRRRRPGDRGLQPRHGPTDVGGARRAAPPAGAPARRALRRRRPARGRGHLRARRGPRVVRVGGARVHPPARPGHPGRPGRGRAARRDRGGPLPHRRPRRSGRGRGATASCWARDRRRARTEAPARPATPGRGPTARTRPPRGRERAAGPAGVPAARRRPGPAPLAGRYRRARRGAGRRCCRWPWRCGPPGSPGRGRRAAVAHAVDLRPRLRRRGLARLGGRPRAAAAAETPSPSP